MSDFEGHLKAGAVASILGIATVIALSATGYLPYYTIAAAVLAIPISMSGALFPDIDHHASKPHKMFKRGVAVIVSVATLALLYANAETIVSALELQNPGFVIGVASVGISLGAGYSMKRIIEIVRPKHRGVTHRAATGMLVSVLVGSLAYTGVATVFTQQPLILTVSGVFAGMFLVGFSSHLYMDGLLFEFSTYTSIK